MSQFCTMSIGERKKRAAAICQEVEGSNEYVMDLGKKLSTPKDIMLEELSLLSNRGSRLFKMRQKRSDKYTFESIQNEANAQLSSNLLNDNIHTVEIKVESAANDSTTSQSNSNPDTTPQTTNASSVSRSYTPWEEMLLRDPDLAETIKMRMPVMDPRPDLPEYKSFNRVATPYGGFDKAPRAISFKLPALDLSPPRYPELQDSGAKRPTFNRTAQGWITESVHMILPTITLEPAEVPESEDL